MNSDLRDTRRALATDDKIKQAAGVVNRILPVSSVRDLGVYLDADVTTRSHVTAVVRSCFAALRQIRSVRRSRSGSSSGCVFWRTAVFTEQLRPTSPTASVVLPTLTVVAVSVRPTRTCWLSRRRAVQHLAIARSQWLRQER